MNTRSILIPALIILAASPALAANYNVPDDYATIQAAINAASLNGDTIQVQEDVYYENISLGGKNITLTSTDPDDPDVVAGTVINGGGSGTVVTFAGTETDMCKLVGFTITGGYTTEFGGGILGNGALAVVDKCVIRDNTCVKAGGGINGINGTISNCLFTGNSALSGGGLGGCQGTITNCMITGNTTQKGSGINNCDGEIINCTMASNTASVEGVLRGCDGSFINCIIWGNSPDTFAEHTASMSYCCWPGGSSGTGNINANPLFVNAAGDDYHLQQTSPCIDTATNSLPVVLSADIEGTPRPLDGDGNGSSINDMGVYEFEPPLYIIVNKETITFATLYDWPGPGDRYLAIQNITSEQLDWSITETCDWLDVTPASGSSMGEDDIVILSVNREGLAAGQYTCQLTINAPGAANSPKTVTVILSLRTRVYE